MAQNNACRCNEGHNHPCQCQIVSREALIRFAAMRAGEKPPKRATFVWADPRPLTGRGVFEVILKNKFPWMPKWAVRFIAWVAHG